MKKQTFLAPDYVFTQPPFTKMGVGGVMVIILRNRHNG